MPSSLHGEATVVILPNRPAAAAVAATKTTTTTKPVVCDLTTARVKWPMRYRANGGGEREGVIIDVSVALFIIIGSKRELHREAHIHYSTVITIYLSSCSGRDFIDIVVPLLLSRSSSSTRPADADVELCTFCGRSGDTTTIYHMTVLLFV